MRFRKESSIFLVIGICVALIAMLAFNLWTRSWKAPYIDAGRFSRLMEKYDGFKGMSQTDAVRLLTRNDQYVVIGESEDLPLSQVVADCEQLDAADKGGISVLLFPVQNSRSPEECFIKGFLMDNQDVLVTEVEVRLSAEAFFELIHTDGRNCTGIRRVP